MRVNELAKELGIPTQKLVYRLKRMKISVTSAVTVLDDKTVARIRKELAPTLAAKVSKKETRKKGVVKKKAAVSRAAEPKEAKKKKDQSPVKKTRARKTSSAVSFLRSQIKEPAVPLKKKVQEEKVEPPEEKVVPAPVEMKKEEKKPEIEKPEVGKVEKPQIERPKEEPLKCVELNFPITVKELSVKLQLKPSALIKRLIDSGIMAGLNQTLSEDIVRKLCGELGVEIREAPKQEELILKAHKEEDKPELLRSRPPIVTLMGHVDHGKTSLLDAIRKSNIVEREYGGITQHIGAYQVALPNGRITFLDTPGHEAFTAMRARGAHITDIVVLVVAADDGVMPQTQEAIDHSKAAGVPIVVAINKIDKPQANIDRVKKQLSELGFVPEDWGGKTIMVGVSAKTGEGIDNLLEMILLEAEMLELKANPERLTRGVVIEGKMTKGSGPVATLLIQNGTLHLGDSIIVGRYYGKIRAMFDEHREAVKEALPSVPVEVLGLSGVPEAGEEFFAVEDEKKARQLAMLREEAVKQKDIKMAKKVTLEDLYAQIKEGSIKELRIILKADVQGSLEAVVESLKKIESKEVQINLLHTGIGSINSSDVILASASNAIVFGFHVKPDNRAQDLIAREEVDVRTYNVIYELINDLKAALEGMLEPKIKRVFLGRAEVRKVFRLSKAGVVAGSFVLKGKILRNALASIVRNGQVVHEGKIDSLKRFKDDVREVGEGFECGISVSNFSDYKEGDIIEVYEEQKIARKL